MIEVGYLVAMLFIQCWSKVNCQDGQPWPVGRSSHAAVCLGYGSQHPQLLVTGGWDEDREVLNDLWILDVQSWTWREVSVLVRL